MASPSPAPGESTPFTKRSKARGSRSGGKPGPSSWTMTATPGADVRSGRSGGQDHVSASRRMAQGVGQQVADDLREADRVRLDRRQLVGHVGRDPDVALGCLGGGPGHRIDEQGPHVERLAVQRQATGLGLGDRAQVVDQSLEGRDGVQDRRQVRGSAG